MNKIDASLLNILVKDGCASYADIARQLGISRAQRAHRVQALVDSGVIELFSAVVNPEELGKVISTFIDLKVVAEIMQALSELARNSTASAISPGCPNPQARCRRC